MENKETDKWTSKEQFKYSELTQDDKEELWEHAFDWCVNIKKEDKVIEILNKIGKSIKEFKNKNFYQIVNKGAKGVIILTINNKIRENMKISINELETTINSLEKLDPFNNKILGFKFTMRSIHQKINKLYSSVERQLRLKNKK